MAKTLKDKKIPAVTVVGAELPGFPQVGLAPFDTEKKAAIYMATIAKKRFPGKMPVLPRRRRADLRRGRAGALQGRGRRHQAGLPEHPLQPDHRGQDRGRRDDRVQQHGVGALGGSVRRGRADAGRERRGSRRHVQGGAGPSRAELPRQLVRRRLVRARAGVRRPRALRRRVVPRSRGLGPGAALAGHDADATARPCRTTRTSPATRSRTTPRS